MLNAQIVTAARSWLGTRFHHQGRLKRTVHHKGGVDCLGLLMGVAGELNLTLADGTQLLTFDKTDYSHYPDTDFLRGQLALAMQQVSLGDIAEGDVLLLNVDGNPQHLAIATNMNSGVLGIIHAYAPARAVVEHALDGWWKSKIQAAFRITP